MSHPDQDLKELVVDPKPCHFCPCEVKTLIKTSFSVCGCPCHWQNTFGLKDHLDAVKYFFGDILGLKNGENEKSKE